MIKDITYKKQGDGLDSWIVKTYDEKGDLLNAELVYENPQNKEVLMWKLKSVLKSMGILTQVGSALENLPEPTKSTALLAWEYSPTVSSNSSVAKFVQNVLGLTEKQVENIFISAEAISLEQEDSQNRSKKANIKVPFKTDEGIIQTQKQSIRIKHNWLQKIIFWAKNFFKRSN